MYLCHGVRRVVMCVMHDVLRMVMRWYACEHVMCLLHTLFSLRSAIESSARTVGMSSWTSSVDNSLAERLHMFSN